MTLTKAAEYLGVSRNTLSRWVEKKTVPAEKDPMDGRRILLKRSDLDDLLQRAGRQPATQP